MLLPLGIIASAGAALADYELITTNLVTSLVTSVTFNSLNTVAADYKHLQIRSTVRDNRGSFTGSNHYLRFNGDTGANYSFHSLYGTGSSAGSGAASGGSVDAIYLGDIPASGGTTGAYGADIVDILDFSQTTKYKTLRSVSGIAQNYNWIVALSGSWRSNSAITSITILDALGSFEPGSRFSLYGLKG